MSGQKISSHSILVMLEDFQEMAKGSRTGQGESGSQNSRPAPGAVTHQVQPLRLKSIDQVVFSFLNKTVSQEKNVNRTPEDTLSGYFLQ